MDIFEAIEAGNFNRVRVLINAEHVDVNQTNEDGVTPLSLAISNVKTEIATILIIKGAVIDDRAELISGYSNIVMALLTGQLKLAKYMIQKGANINAPVDDWGSILHIVVEFNLREFIDMLLKKPEINVNMLNNKGQTPLYVASEHSHIDTVKKLLNHPTINTDIKYDGKTILELAKENKFSPETNATIISSIKVPALWKGWTKADASSMEAIFDPENPQALDDVSYCPICLGYTRRGGGAGETKGCMYMKHKCPETGVMYHRELYNRYKTPDGYIYWCTICNRICNGHSHYILSAPYTDPAIPLPPLIRPTGSPFDKSCTTGNGGGGVEEKLRRFIRMRELASELNERIGEITVDRAVETLVEEMWIAGMPDRRNIKRVNTLKMTKKFNQPSESFPANRPNNETANTASYPDAVRSSENIASLRPIISMDQPKYDSIELDTLAPAVLFNHRTRNGEVVKHKQGDGPEGDGGEWVSFKTVKDRLAYYIKNRKADDFGQCPLQCGALIYPDEIKDIAPELYDPYKKVFNEYMATMTGGAGKRMGRKTIKRGRGRSKQRGGFEGIFYELKDAVCSIPKIPRKERKTRKARKARKSASH